MDARGPSAGTFADRGRRRASTGRRAAGGDRSAAFRRPTRCVAIRSSIGNSCRGCARASTDGRDEELVTRVATFETNASRLRHDRVTSWRFDPFRHAEGVVGDMPPLEVRQRPVAIDRSAPCPRNTKRRLTASRHSEISMPPAASSSVSRPVAPHAPNHAARNAIRTAGMPVHGRRSARCGN